MSAASCSSASACTGYLPHREQTIRRMKAQKTVLCVQDGSKLNYNGADQCVGLDVIGSNQTGAKSLGLHLHSTLVVTCRRGLFGQASRSAAENSLDTLEGPSAPPHLGHGTSDYHQMP